MPPSTRTKLLSISLSPGACADEGQSEGRRSKLTTAGKHPKHDGAVEGKSKKAFFFCALPPVATCRKRKGSPSLVRSGQFQPVPY
jgi:hypothetical protein